MPDTDRLFRNDNTGDLPNKKDIHKYYPISFPSKLRDNNTGNLPIEITDDELNKIYVEGVGMSYICNGDETFVTKEDFEKLKETEFSPELQIIMDKGDFAFNLRATLGELKNDIIGYNHGLHEDPLDGIKEYVYAETKIRANEFIKTAISNYINEGDDLSSSLGRNKIKVESSESRFQTNLKSLKEGVQQILQNIKDTLGLGKSTEREI